MRVPETVSAPLAASAACALRTIMHGFERLGAVGSHETFLVQGAGPVGLYAAAVARARGARQVLVIGAPHERLEIARALGADDVLDLDAGRTRRRGWPGCARAPASGARTSCCSAPRRPRYPKG